MCGIGGIINFKEEVEKEQLATISESLKYRGPDNSGTWTNEGVGFVHTRLSIIDLSSAGNQPMRYDNIVLVFNGEIYNFKTLRSQLEKESISFNTQSDSEVLLKAYQAWGIEKTLDKLDGMFAFALFDDSRQKVYFGRDRFGKKPLYIYRSAEKCIFSSEIKPISRLVPNLTIDKETIDYYLTELASPQPKTIWKEVTQLKQGHYSVLDVKNGDYKELEYHRFKVNKEDYGDEKQVLDRLEKKLVDAILKRTIADVPVGCFLSGGVDSGLIVSLLAQNTSEKVKTYSVGFEEQDYNELEQARIVADRYATEHHEFILGAENVADNILDLLDYIDEPFADPSILPTFLVCKEISKHVKVALSGDGGDEIFGGYGEYLTAYNTHQFALQTPSFFRPVKAGFSKVKGRLLKSNTANEGLYNSFLSMPGSEKLYRHMGFDYGEKKQYLTEQFNSGFSKRYLDKLWSGREKELDIVDNLFLSSLSTRLLNNYLVKVDRMSMKNGLEVRSPFLDIDLANYAFNISNDLKFGNGVSTKYLLKKMAAKYFDPNVFSRPKSGFEPPIRKWIRTDLKEMILDVLGSKKFRERGIFNGTQVEKLIENHINGTLDATFKIWALFCLELWFRKNEIK